MRRLVLATLVLLAIVAVAPAVSASLPDLAGLEWIDGMSDLSPTQPTAIGLYLASAPDGLASYTIKFSRIEGVDIVGVVLPEWVEDAGMVRDDEYEVSIQGIDSEGLIPKGAGSVHLATIIVARDCYEKPDCPRAEKAVAIKQAWYFDDESGLRHVIGAA